MVQAAERTRQKIEDYLDAFRLIAPFIHPSGDDIEMTLYICIPFQPLRCDVISPRPGDCPIHKTALTPHIYTWR